MRDPAEIDVYADDLTTDEAARLADVEPGTVRSWKSRGHLIPRSRDARGRPLYAALDVAKAEAATRAHARRP